MKTTRFPAHRAPAAARPGLREHDQALIRDTPRRRRDGGDMSLDQAGPGFERDIPPLFRSEDVNAISFAFNLAPTRTSG
jgi:hypothetical protein